MALRVGPVGPLREAGLGTDAGLGESVGPRIGDEFGPALPTLPWNSLAARAGLTLGSSSAGIQRPTQNWHGPGESDCLIKTKHCDGPRGC